MREATYASVATQAGADRVGVDEDSVMGKVEVPDVCKEWVRKGSTTRAKRLPVCVALGRMSVIGYWESDRACLY